MTADGPPREPRAVIREEQARALAASVRLRTLSDTLSIGTPQQMARSHVRIAVALLEQAAQSLEEAEGMLDLRVLQSIESDRAAYEWAQERMAKRWKRQEEF